MLLLELLLLDVLVLVVEETVLVSKDVADTTLPIGDGGGE